MRLIDADEIKEWLHGKQLINGEAFEYFIDALPTITTEPVRHGDWRFVPTDEMKKRRGEFSFLWASDTWMNYECTVCGYMIHNTLHNGADNRSRYCPNCGARMDEVSV